MEEAELAALGDGVIVCAARGEGARTGSVLTVVANQCHLGDGPGRANDHDRVCLVRGGIADLNYGHR
eukprot:15471933-Alexandrium_andersonii.AAC.1